MTTTNLQEKIDQVKNYFYNDTVNTDNTVILNESLNLNKPRLNNIKNISSIDDVKNLRVVLDEMYKLIEIIEDENDIKEFNTSGKVFDFDKLRKVFCARKLDKKFPKFNLERYFELLEKPITRIKNYDGEIVEYNLFWIKKNLIAINQMIIDEMDLYILNIGKEGSGKSCWSSQQILYFYTFLTEIGLIEYSYDITNMFFIDISDFLESNENQERKDYFRIKCLDEGNQLNRSNFRDEDNQQFKYEMRTERKLIRIIMLNMQQIGELDTSISLSRVNFIYDCKMRNKKTLGILDKGFINMYIIPRGDNVYSSQHKKNINRIEILNAFAKKLDKKKDYYVDLPREYIANKFKFDNVWGFDKDKYDDFVKDKMVERRFQKKMKLTDEQGYILITKLKDFKNIYTFDNSEPKDKKMYETFKKFIYRIEKYFESNPEKMNSIRAYYDRKV